MARLNRCVITDPATDQMGKQISTDRFIFEEGNSGEVEIDLREYTQADIQGCIVAYGYTLYATGNTLTNIRELYGRDADWTIAECLFEMRDDR